MGRLIMARRPEEIGLNAPTEVIDVPRSTTYAPVEFSGQIAATQEGRSSLAEIPKSAAGIVLAHNEYKRTEKEGDIALDDTQDALNQKDLEETFKLSENNRIQDMSMRMLDTMDKRRKEALADPNGSIYNATQEVFEEYEMPDEFLNSPYAMAQWQNMHNNYQKTLAPKAFDTDREREVFRMKYNVEQQLGIATGMIYSGSTFEEAYKHYMKQISSYRGVVDDKELMTWLNDGGEKLLSSLLSYKVHNAQAEGLDAEAVDTLLKEFRDAHEELTFTWTDTNDKVIMDGENPATYKLVMSNRIHNEIEQQRFSLVTSAAKKAGTGIALDMGDLGKATDYDKFKKTGFSNWMQRTSLPDMIKKTDSWIAEVNAGGGSSGAKATRIKRICSMLGPMILTKQIADGISASDASPASINQFTSRLDLDINKGGYTGKWADYTCEIKVGDKTLKMSLPDEIKQHLATDEQAQALWKDTLAHVTTFAKSGSKSANFLSITDSEYGKAEEALVAQLVDDPETGETFRSRYIESLGEGKFRAINTDKLREYFRNLSQIQEAKDAGQEGLSDNALQAITYTLNNIEDLRERLAGAAAIATAMREEGYAGQALLNLSAKNGKNGNSEITDTPMMLQVAMFLTKEDYNMLDDALARGLDIKQMANAYQTGDANRTNRQAVITAVLNDMKIPSTMHKAMFFALDIMSNARAQTATTPSEREHRTWLEKRARAMVNENFHKFSPDTHMETRVYKYSRQMYNQDVEQLDKSLSTTIKFLSPYFDTKRMSFQTNAETGDFDITYDKRVVKGLTVSGDIAPVASMITKYTRQDVTDNAGKRIDPDRIGAYIAMQTYMGIMARDNATIQQIVDDRRKKEAVTHIAKDVSKHGPFTPMNWSMNLFLAMNNKGWLDNKTKEEKPVDIRAIREKAIDYSIVLSDPVMVDLYLSDPGPNPSGWVMPGTKTLSNKIDALALKVTGQLEGLPSELHNRFSMNPHIIDVMHWAEQYTVGASKIKQGGASLPMAAAANGEDYYDQQAAAKEGGYNISGVEMDGVAQTAPIELDEEMDEDGDIGVPTGMAAPITPKKTEYTKADLQDRAKKAADKYQIPRSLMNALVVQESGYKVDAKSKAGASGLMQLMPATAKSLGVTDIFDVDQNIDAGARYLQQQYKRFGSWPLALAAYNAGPGAVEDYKNGTNFTGGNPNKRKTGGIPNYPETQNYVKNIMAKSGLNKRTYGINFDIASNKNRFIDSDMGMLSVNGMTKFLDMINKTNAYRGKVESITTNRRELLEDKPEYRDFAKFRAMRNADGKPLFVAGDVDGFRVNVKKQGTNTLNPAAITALAEDAVNHQAEIYSPVSHETARTLLRIFDNRYDTDKDKQGTFGLANLSIEEYNKYGIPLTCMDNALLQNRVLVHEFQRATDLLGSERKAIFALAGGDLRTPEGEVKSWKDIKSDDMAYEKEWYISPSADDKRRNTINQVLAMFDKLRDYATKEA